MEGVIEHYRQVIFNEPRYHKLLDWLCVLLIVFISVYGTMFLIVSRRVEQGVVIPETTPYQKSVPGAYTKQYPIEQT